jgi:hypothetical protein
MRVVNSWIATATMVSGLVFAADPGSSTTLAKVDCTLTKESVALKARTISLPTTGAVVIESHLATTEDQFPDHRLFPVQKGELLDAHQARSCQKIGELPITASCKDAYKEPRWVVQAVEKSACGSIAIIC